MTDNEALATMKRKCLVLKQFFTDEELAEFLAEYRTGEGTELSPFVYDVRRATYDALTSALTVAEQSTTRGGVSVTYANLFSLRKQFATAGTISLVGRCHHARI